MSSKLVNYVPQNHLDDLLGFLKNNSYDVFLLNAEEINSEVAFFKKVAESFPLIPFLEVHDLPKWQYLEDSLWEGITENEITQCAIVITGVGNLTENFLPYFIELLSILIDTSRALLKFSKDIPRKVTLQIYLVGHGNSFKRQIL